MEKCQRCNGKEAMFACMQCESFRLLCERCDNYIHGLPGKKGHNRVAMTPQGEKSLRDKQNNNKNNNKNNNNTYQPQELPPLKETIENNNDIYNSNNCNNVNSSKDEDQMNVEMSTSNNKIRGNNDKEFSYSTLYSRDYLNELKSMYNKDKIDLECQGSSLRSNLEKIRLNFGEQLKSLSSQIEEFEFTHANASKSLEEKYREKYQNIIYDKENMISSLNDAVSTLQKQNEMLHTELKTQNEENHQKIIEYERHIQQLQNEIIKKEEENYILKSQMDNIVSHNQNILQSESTRLMTQYENKIHQILNDADLNREQLLKIITERENDIKNLVNSNRQQSEELIVTVKRLKEENEKINYQLQNAIEEREQIEKNLAMIKQDHGQLIQETQKKENFVNKIDDTNKKLSEENKELKEKVKKLEAIIYGKIKTTSGR